MAKFTMQDFSNELFIETGMCESPVEVQALFASKGYELSDKTAEKFFAFTREADLDDEMLDRVAGGTCSSDSSESKTPCPA